MGYSRAGAAVVGVDVKRWSYPFPFARYDALTFLQRLNDGGGWIIEGERYDLTSFDLIHASPPCQLYTAGNRAHVANPHPDLVNPTRELLKASGVPYVIENVPGAPLDDPVELCGRMFNLGATDSDGTWLQLDRHRLFETSFPATPPPTCRPHDRSIQVGGVYAGARRDKEEARFIRGGGYVPRDVGVLRALLGCEWMTEKELYLAIPPRYTEWVLEAFLKV